MGCDTVEEGKEASGGGRLLLVKEEVLGNLKGSMHKDNSDTDDEDESDRLVVVGENGTAPPWCRRKRLGYT
ncbi:PRA1 family protein B4 [Pyrus ussuriensis x Pyrus communis]|uniref:PRA1 family protein B4 n=1 Tax=Pyrus ussuriensis x Pyrus communis TaxID=2448454 RepID=A0A5N5H650_9ROSA|nr:PRA1 family protein B4 [Pyrus ussuriensis x Pyrus communis]